MSGPFSKTETAKDPLLKAGEALTRRARLWMIWERYAPVLALAALIITLFLAGAYAGLWQRIGDPWRLIALILTLYFLIKAAVSASREKIPSHSEAARRVERDSGVSHRPLETLRDRPVLGDALWEQHQAKARAAAKALNPATPIRVIGPRDKYFMRFVAPIVLVLAVIVGIGDNGERLRRALSPSWQSPMDPAKVTFDAWVDPPDYTGRPPVYFKGQQTVDIPAGSELVARIQGLKDAPRLKLETGGLFGSKYLKLKRLGPDSFEARTILSKSAKAKWQVGSKRRLWNLVVVQDTAPQVDWVAEPKADKRDRLSFQYSLKDDYGVENLVLEMSLLEGGAAADTLTEDTDAKDTVIVPLAGKSVRETKGTDAVLDLTKHKWAGQKVKGRLIAADGTGETAQSEFAYFTIPDKIFIEPIAKAVAEQRLLVMSGLTSGQSYTAPPRRTRKEWGNLPRFDDWETDQKLGRAPKDVQRAADLIEAITDAPAGLYEDPAVFIGLKNTLSTLRHSREIAALEPVPDNLWSIAIRAEFGSLGSALEEMREAEANLNEGIARRAPQREIDTLFQRYDAAVERYIKQLTEEAMENMAESEGGGGGGGRSTDEIEELLKAIEEANRIGDTEGARIALKKLAELLENLKIQMAQGGQGEGGDPSSGEMSEEMKESLEELADLLGEQRELKDETDQAEKQAENEGQSQQPGDQGQGAESGGEQSGQGQQALSADELAERQEKLAELLGGVQDKLPEGSDAAGPSGDGDQDGGDQDGSAPGSGEEPAENGAGGGGENDPNSERRGAGGADGAEPLISPGDALEDAARAMQRAEDALNSGDLDAAAQAQADAIEALRNAGQGLAQQARQERGEDGQQAEQGNPLGQDGQDGENNDLSQQDIDPRDNATRSRELLEELRRRAAEQEREQQERDYLERLLKRF